MKRKRKEEAPESRQLSSVYSPTRKSLILREPQTLTAGERIRRERYLRKLTLEQMSDYLDISPSYLGSIERGKRPVSRHMMELLHERLDISYDYLLEGISISSSQISQYVRESGTYSRHHSLNVLLNVCNNEELDSCYQLIHTYLTGSRKSRVSNTFIPDEAK